MRVAAESLPNRSLVLSGHIHQPEAWAERVGNAWCFNCGYPSRGGDAPNHIQVDLAKGRAAFYGEPTWEGEEPVAVQLW